MQTGSELRRAYKFEQQTRLFTISLFVQLILKLILWLAVCSIIICSITMPCPQEFLSGRSSAKLGCRRELQMAEEEWKRKFTISIYHVTRTQCFASIPHHLQRRSTPFEQRLPTVFLPKSAEISKSKRHISLVFHRPSLTTITDMETLFQLDFQHLTTTCC